MHRHVSVLWQRLGGVAGLGSMSRGSDFHLLLVLLSGHGEIPLHPPQSGLDRNSPGRQLPRPTCYCGQGAQRGGRGSPNLPHPRLRLLTFLNPHSLPWVGWGDLIAQQEERNKHSWGACCVPGTVLNPRPPPSHSVPRHPWGVGGLMLFIVQVRKQAQRG